MANKGKNKKQEKPVKKEILNQVDEVENAEETNEKKIEKTKSNENKKNSVKAKNKKKKKEVNPNGFKSEFKKIIWPKGKELFEKTVVVVTIVVFFATLILLLDLGFKKIRDLQTNQIHKMIDKNVENSTTLDTSIKTEEVSQENKTEGTNSEENKATN